MLKLSGKMKERCDILIGSCKEQDELVPLVQEVEETRTTSGVIITNCSSESASFNRNICMAESAADYMIIMDDDVFGFQKGWDELLIAPLRNDPQISMTSALYFGPENYHMVGGSKRESLIVEDAKWLPSTCCAMRQTHLRFDESYKGYGLYEDRDFCYQISSHIPEAKFVFVSDCRIKHRNENKNIDPEVIKQNEKVFKTKWSI